MRPLTGVVRRALRPLFVIVAEERIVPVVSSVLHVDERVVKPHDTGKNRTVSAESDARVRRVRSSRAENRRFFPNRLHTDGPRTATIRPTAPLVAAVHALGIGTLAVDDTPCPVPMPDTDAPPATHRPTSGRITAALATIASQTMSRTKPSPTPLQQTNSRSATCRALPSRPIAIMIFS